MRGDARGVLERTQVVGRLTGHLLRAVIGTNVLLSSLLRRDSTPAAVLVAWSEDRFTLLTHPLQLEELRDVTWRLHIRHRLRRAEAGALINDIRSDAEIILALPHVRRSPDPADDFLLALCKADVPTIW